MTDTTDDIAEEISFQSFDDDCRMLRSLLQEVLQREVGGQFMDKVERNRILAQVFTHRLCFYLVDRFSSTIPFALVQISAVISFRFDFLV